MSGTLHQVSVFTAAVLHGLSKIVCIECAGTAMFTNLPAPTCTVYLVVTLSAGPRWSTTRIGTANYYSVTVMLTEVIKFYSITMVILSVTWCLPSNVVPDSPLQVDITPMS